MTTIDTACPPSTSATARRRCSTTRLWSGQLAAWAGDLPRPKAILIVSAHWESAPVSLSASGAELVYDFGGFDPKYYPMTYRTPDATALAERIAS